MDVDAIRTVSDEDFDLQVVHSDRPVLVDFWAQWCGPCRMVAPVLNEIAEDYAGRLIVAKLNVDVSQQTASRYQVSSIPTFILFKNGAVADRMMGAMPKGSFEKFISRNA